MKFKKLEIELKSRGWGENEEFYYAGQIRFEGDDRSLISLQIPEETIIEFMRLSVGIFDKTAREKIDYLLNQFNPNQIKEQKQ